MTEEQEVEGGVDPEPVREPVVAAVLNRVKSRSQKTRLVRWAKRRSVRQIRRELARDRDRPRPGEDQENADTCPPDDESVKLAGLVLIEAYPPSIVASLQKQLEDWPAGDRDRKTGALNMLTRSRTGAGAGSSLL